MIVVKSYTPDHKSDWDAFVAQSKNEVFLFYRDYMDYHSDRFTDASLMFYRDDKLFALLPASAHGKEIVSHGGLTYGGILSDKNMKAVHMLDVFEAFKNFYTTKGFETIRYKAIPHIFQSPLAEEDLYALFRYQGKLVRRDISSCVEISNKLKFSKGKKNGISKAKKANLSVVESEDFEAFIDLLTERLEEKFETKPVHMAEEIKLLKSKFPGKIRLFCAYHEEAMIAATLVFENNDVIHTQYIATNDFARDNGAIDFIFNELINERYKDKKYFNFGISTEKQGLYLNEGLIAQKEMYGARSICIDTYEMDLNATIIDV